MARYEEDAELPEVDAEMENAGESFRDEEAESRQMGGRRNLTGRSCGIYARRTARRLAVDELLRRAELLPRVARAIVRAHYDAGVPGKELAMLNRTTPLKMWRVLNHWRDTLSDPAFLLAAKFRDALPHELETLAEAHWMQGQPLRTLAQKRKVTVYAVRKELGRARSMLLLEASRRGAAAESVGKLL